MKFNLSCVVYLTCMTSLFAQTRYDINLISEGRLRECIVVKPSTSPPIGGYPIVFMLHGTSQDGELFYDNSGWKELGEQENFITVYPTSLRWCYMDDGVETHGLRWVNGQVTDVPCSGTPQNYISDVHFLKLLAKKIADTFPVNPAMIFASGFSNGSGMIHKLAIDAGDVFAACAGSGSFLSAGDSAKPVHRIPVWAMLGTNDDRFIRPPYTEIPFGADSVLAYLYNPLQRMVDCQGVTQNFTKFETAITHTYEFKENNSADTGQLYRFTLVKDMFHVYPNGMNFRLEAAKLFWEFFKNSVTVNTEHPRNISNEILAIPNPSNDLIELSIPANDKSYQWSVFDAYGRLRMNGNQISGERVQCRKSDLGTGMYIFQVRLGDKVISQKIIFQ
ncbi:MAG: T9SS type A sorting domain-containing protein [Saprospiraceae bacterium]|uniref:T9SS type A sorting domain-containing protein n=1 Tax=Candidatus Defluviibacterium haderslevense TaxID=2981993 RepID=A0A9D7S5D3_9BACT|nr:T9SS type A sorting domain-containing protein [Candidatus Defluviibacterium haderslevense]